MWLRWCKEHASHQQYQHLNLRVPDSGPSIQDPSKCFAAGSGVGLDRGRGN